LQKGSGEQTVKVVNLTKTAVPVALAATACPASGAGKVSVSPATATIPAGEATTLTLSVSGFKSGTYTGDLHVMAGGNLVARAPFGFVVK
jgi:hypothetical protein